MESPGLWEVEQVISVLLDGQKWARQLLQVRSPASEEQQSMIAQRIDNSFSKSLSMLNYTDHSVEHISNVLNSAPESPLSAVYDVSPMSKKRKTFPKRAERIRVCPYTGMEAPMDDGYSWRKYGQKDILGAKHPRGYFRCTHKNTQGCQATKQVQRSDEDPTIFDVIYKGLHTCRQAAHAKARSLTPSPEQQADYRKQTLLSFGNDLNAKTENSDDTHNLNPPAHFSFPPASMESIKQDVDIFSCIDNPFLGSFSPANFISPETSESNYFCFNGGPRSESELTEIISASTSVANSPMLDLDSFSLDVNFPFDDDTFLA